MSQEYSSSKQHRMTTKTDGVSDIPLMGLALFIMVPLLPFKLIGAAVRDFSKGRALVKDFCIILVLCIVSIPFMPLLVVIGLVLVISGFIERLLLICRVRLSWYPQGKRLLYVYSDSPIWKERIESEVLPKIKSAAVILNWSQRGQWQARALPIKIFRYWVGTGEEFNPAAVTFIPWWRPKVFRFWQAYKDFKHGNTAALDELEREFFKVARAGIG